MTSCPSVIKLPKHMIMPICIVQNQEDQEITEHAVQLLVKTLVISRLDYPNTFLAGLPAKAIKRIQLVQIAELWLIFKEPKKLMWCPSSSLHLLPIKAWHRFKSLTLAYGTIIVSAPSYCQTLILSDTPS